MDTNKEIFYNSVAREQYEKYYQRIRKCISPKLDIAMDMHDNYLVEKSFSGNNYVLSFDPTYSASDTTKLTFVNAEFLSDDNPPLGSCCLDMNLYLENGRYRTYLLFFGEGNNQTGFPKIEILSDDVIPEVKFTNLGRCLECGEWVSDPNKPGYDPAFPSGVFFDADWSWYCDNCKKIIHNVNFYF